MNNKNSQIDFCQVYVQAHNNAIELLSHAEILFGKQIYTIAYFLAYTGLEEISKSQLAADVFTGFINEKEF
jgi:AbiV family abortive infection protein